MKGNNQNLYKSFLKFAIPAMLTGMLNQAFNIIDTIFAGKFLGENGIAAIGSTAQIITLISCAISGYTVGFSVLLAKLWGAKDYEGIKTNVYTTAVVLGTVTLAIGLILGLSSGKIVELLRADVIVRQDAQTYFMIYAMGFVLICFRHLGNYIMQAFGNTVYPFLVSIVTSVIHIICSYIFVRVFGIGIAGFAIAYLLSALLADICYLIRIVRYFKSMNLSLKPTKSKASMREAMTYSLPTLIQQAVMYTADTMTAPLINGLGASMTSAYSVASRVNTFTSQGFQSSSKALSNYAARCIGVGRGEEIKKGVKVSFLQSLFLLLPFVLVSYIFAEPICKMFFSKDFSGDSLNYAVLFLRVYMPLVVFNVINNLFHSFFRGIKAMGFLNLTTAVGAFSRYLLTLLLVGGYGINGVYTAWAVSWVIEAILCVAIYFSNRWKKCVNMQINKGA